VWLACQIRPSLFRANTVPTMAEFAARWLAVEQYQSIGDTIVQLFISQASVLITHVDRTQNPSRPGMGEGTAFCAASKLVTFRAAIRLLIRSVPPSARPGRLSRWPRL
jgi:hypothetical protein